MKLGKKLCRTVKKSFSLVLALTIMLSGRVNLTPEESSILVAPDGAVVSKTPEEFLLTVPVLRTVPSSLAKRYVTEEKSFHSLFLVRLI